MKSFAEILTEKIISQNLNQQKTPTEVDGNSPLHLAYLIGQLPKWPRTAIRNSNSTKPFHRQFANEYALQMKKFGSVKSLKKNSEYSEKSNTKTTEIKSTKPHSLNADQTKSLKFFIQLGAQLKPDFNSDELRCSFRMLALSVHPDRHSEAQKEKATRSFQELKVAYEQLKTIFKTAK